MLLLKLKYKFNYYFKALCFMFYICPKCFSKLNILRNGKKICTNGHCK